ncbi:hypothetical protein K1719_000223 [Acacia pycnantha]|nr:hypothetical protein K1719_000223 [Acacia pycnantha]
MPWQESSIHLPEEVIVDILLRLPVKSLLRFSSISPVLRPLLISRLWALAIPPLDPDIFVYMYGFAYDESTDDYIIVVVSDFLALFSLKANSWEILDDECEYTYQNDMPTPGSILNGAIHWIFAVFLFVFYLRRGQAGAVEHLILFGFNLVLLGTHRRSKTVEKKYHVIIWRRLKSNGDQLEGSVAGHYRSTAAYEGFFGDAVVAVFKVFECFGLVLVIGW